MKLSIVDQSPVSAGSTPADALQNSIELARLADKLGYQRYWIAEHHAMDTLASPAPEILLARIGAETARIRLGSGGVLLPHYAPLKVAETFRMLHALYPGRIDLGIGRAPGGTPLESLALRRDRRERAMNDDFPEQLTELLSFLLHDFDPSHPFGRIKVAPEMPGSPSVWLLGSSMWSAQAAARFGLPYAFAHFIDPQTTRAALDYYREHFVTGQYLPHPQALVALGAVCAPTKDEADWINSSTRLLIKRIRQGDRRPIAPPEEALEELATGPDPSMFDLGEWPRYAVGTPEQVRDQLTSMAKELKVEEVMIVTVVHSHQARMKSYQLLAQAFEI
jgi:luciferase family oxidoreductase group 1